MNISPNDFIKKILGRVRPQVYQTALSAISHKTIDIIDDLRVQANKYSSNLISDSSAQLYVDDVASYDEMINSMLVSILESDDYINGTFCKISCPDWEHIQTAYILKILYNLGMINAIWGESHSIRSIKIIIEGLINGQHEEGSWGEDFYDTCYTLNILFLYYSNYQSIEQYKETIGKALAWVTATIENNFIDQVKCEWYGAGFIGSSLTLFCNNYIIIGTNFKLPKNTTIDTIINSLTEKAKFYYREDTNNGFFTSDTTSQPSTPDIWHTAEMILGLSDLLNCSNVNHQYEEFNTILNNSIEWLYHQKHEHGLWYHDMGRHLSFIVTGRVINAFCEVSRDRTDIILRDFLLILRQHCETGSGRKGLIYNLPVTINILNGLSSKKSIYRKEEVNQYSTALLAKHVNTTLEDLNQLVEFTKNEKQKRFSAYFFTIVVVLLVLIIAIPSLNKIAENFKLGQDKKVITQQEAVQPEIIPKNNKKAN